MATHLTDWIKQETTKNTFSAKRKFGHTARVVHKATNEQGVLKMIDKSKVSPETIEQLRVESSLSFTEKGLPEIRAIFENDNYFSFVKRYQEGIHWQTYVDTLSDTDFYAHLPKALLQLVELLHKVHQKGYLHGDIKPSNVLINANSPIDFQMELIDFGLSFTIGAKKEANHPFSLGFAPPELMLNKLELANETTDFYSLAISIYTLITGEIPLVHPNPELFINLQLTHPLIQNSKIPKSVFELIEKMTQKPQFSIPPNQMEVETVEEILKTSIKQRLNYLELRDYLSNMEIKKKWFKFR
jgi:serine/threonine protein kinase